MNSTSVDAEHDVALLPEHARLLDDEADDDGADDARRAASARRRATTIIRRATDVAQPNVGGLMKPFMCASRLPAAPAMAELTRSSVTFTRVTSTPDVRHAVSFSRMARQRGAERRVQEPEDQRRTRRAAPAKSM